jgi:CheY-like chemotaxis protein
MVSLKGSSILVVEDENIVAMDLDSLLCNAGCSVVGPIGTVEEALAAVARCSVDGAVLDLNLHGKSAFPIMDALACATIPFIIVTGYSRAAIPARFRRCGYIEKPYGHAPLLETLAVALNRP